MNPLDKDDMFPITLGNPNPTSSKTKEGPVYRVSFELNREEWDMFMEAETKGMLIECMCQVAHRNEKKTEPARDPDTVDLVDNMTDNERKKGGPLSIRAAALCREKEFLNYLECFTEDFAADLLRERCGVESRAELDHNADAAKKFKDMLSHYIRWREGDT